ncbi:MAG: divalent-cation tolerance protein CutA [Candidatus Eisenbacteria bacterium]|nr:divalent-cation tolerance protein CutA [Candidatus Eisenbacteria bacterium]
MLHCPTRITQPPLRRPGEHAVTDLLLVFSTFASEDDAARVVRALVAERLVACGSLLPGARSIYRWKGEVADQREVVALMKTRKQDWPALLSRLHELHPYEVPECIAVRLAAGAPKYLAWLEEALGPEAG